MNLTNARAMINYRADAYPGCVVHISARHSLEAMESDHKQDTKAIAGWHEIVQGQLTEYEIDGTHESILQAPYLTALVGHLRAELISAQDK